MYYVFKYGLYEVKLLLVRVVVETFNDAALHVEVFTANLNMKWIGSLCLWCVVHPSQQYGQI